MCKDCIHYDVCADCICNHYIDATKCENYISYADVQEALERQIPKKPFAMAEHCKGCPTCENAVSRDFEKGFSFCMMCGQALDWRDDKNC